MEETFLTFLKSNAWWVKECEWIENPETDWSILSILALGLHR
ncbi:MAG: hypothetical protein ACLTD6_00920 [Clostridium paraputrificum]